MPQIASNITVTKDEVIGGAIQGNGKYFVYVSDTFQSNNNKGVDATIQVHDVLPNRDNPSGFGKAVFNLVLERLDDAGNWHPVHSLYEPIKAVEIGSDRNGGVIADNQLTYGPGVFNFDGAVPIAASDGDNIIFLDHQKRGVMPSKFRFVLVVHEKEFGNAGAFESITFSLDYELRSE